MLALWKRYSAQKKLKGEISNDLKVIKTFRKQLNSDRVLISQQIARAKGLPSAQADRVIQSSGLSDENIAFVRSITGEQINQWISRAKGFGGSLSSEDAQLTHVRGQGRRVTFLEDNPLPQVLIRRGQFNGRLQLASSNMSVTGTLSDICLLYTSPSPRDS